MFGSTYFFKIFVYFLAALDLGCCLLCCGERVSLVAASWHWISVAACSVVASGSLWLQQAGTGSWLLPALLWRAGFSGCSKLALDLSCCLLCRGERVSLVAASWLPLAVASVAAERGLWRMDSVAAWHL